MYVVNPKRRLDGMKANETHINRSQYKAALLVVVGVPVARGSGAAYVK
jgi:hypothetical protein